MNAINPKMSKNATTPPTMPPINGTELSFDGVIEMNDADEPLVVKSVIVDDNESLITD